MITFESKLKNSNTWLTINSQSETNLVNLLRKASIKSLLDVVSSSPDKDFYFTAHWAFDSKGKRTGYYLSVFVTGENGDKYEIQPTTKYPWQETRVFKTLEAVESYAVELGAQSIAVDFG